MIIEHAGSDTKRERQDGALQWWTVHDKKGRIVGRVVSASFNGALKQAEYEYPRISLTVREEGQK